MHRKIRRRQEGGPFSVDSLMDILTCTVGMMLLIVIFAVIEARGVRVKMTTPILVKAPAELQRELIVCTNGMVRRIAIDSCINNDELFEGIKPTYDNAPTIVNNFNRKAITDGWFTYSLDLNDWTEEEYPGKFSEYRTIVLVIDEKPGVPGEDETLLSSGNSLFESLLSNFDADSIWLSFAVDNQSLDAFREARQLAAQRGLATGWYPSSIAFPHRETIYPKSQYERGTYGPSSNSEDILE